MNQWQYDTTLKVIEAGAPALYPELSAALKNLVEAFQKNIAENKELKEKVEEIEKKRKNHQKTD